MARKNEAVRLQCKVEGSPPATNFTWVKNGKVITVDDRVKIESDGALLINPVHTRKYKLDVGEYQCFASSSKFTIASRKVRLEVAGKSWLQCMFLTHCGYFPFLAFLIAWSEQLQFRADYIVEREVCMSSPQRLKFLSEHSVLPAAYENLETYDIQKTGIVRWLLTRLTAVNWKAKYKFSIVSAHQLANFGYCIYFGSLFFLLLITRSFFACLFSHFHFHFCNDVSIISF